MKLCADCNTLKEIVTWSGGRCQECLTKELRKLDRQLLKDGSGRVWNLGIAELNDQQDMTSLARKDSKYKKRIMTQLTTEMAKMWKAGRWKYSYTNLNYKDGCQGFLAVSGRYFYLINFTGPRSIVKFKDVPKTYQKYVKPDKIIYRVPSKLMEVAKRPGCD